MRSTPLLGLPLAAAVLFSASSYLTAQTLVRDIRTSSTANNGNSLGSSADDAFVAGGSRAFFIAWTQLDGFEPYVTDGTSAGTRRILELVPGSGHLNPRMLFAANGSAVFVTEPTGGQSEFYATDGTAAGTQSLGGLGISGNGQHRAARLANGRIVLTRTVGTTATSFATDLTAAGTRTIPGMQGFAATDELGGLAIGVSTQQPNTSGGRALWATDGTVAGSVLLADDVLVRVVGTQKLQATAKWNGRVWFFRQRPTGPELWSTDGTLAGTAGHAQIAGGSSNFLLAPPTEVANGLVFLFAGQLWFSDGSVAGTAPIVGMPCNAIQQITPFQGRAYFSAVAVSAPGGFEPWSTDGTAAGTTLVAEIGPGGENGSPLALTPSPQGVWFRAQRGANGANDLYLCPGPQTMLQVGSLPGTGTQPTAPFTPFGGGVLMAITEPVTGTEPWFATPSQAPFLLADVHRSAPGIDTITGVRGRDRLFFAADDGVHGRELWSTDGTANGTTMVDVQPGSAGSFPLPTSVRMVPFRNGIAADVIQLGMTPARQVMVSDGTVAGTRILPFAQLSGNPLVLATRGDELFAYDGRRLFRSDGTAAGTTTLPILNGSTGGTRLFALPTRLVFEVGNNQLQGTDGVQPPQPISLGLVSGVVGELRGRVLFADSRGLVASDGTPAGTVVLASNVTAPVFGDGDGNRIAFADASALWLTDGTPAGTRPLAPLSGNTTAGRIALTEGGVFVVRTEPTSGRELHRYDDVLGQLVLAFDLNAGPGDGVENVRRVGDGNTLLLSATDGSDGFEPYVSDGTAAGTSRIADVMPGSNGSAPLLLGTAGRKAYFVANDLAAGRELHVVDLGTLGAASVQPIGAGCFGSFGRPSLAANSTPRLGASGFGFTLGGTRANTFAALLFGDALGSGNFAGCSIAPAGATTTQVTLTTTAGGATFALPIPNAAPLLGLCLTTQGFALDSFVPAGFAGSDAVLFVVGA